MSSAPALILASTSRYRAELLARLRVPFTAVAPEVPETPRSGEPPMDRAQRLAREKAEAVAARHPDALVIGSDQVAAAADGAVLDKPGDARRAEAQLARLGGTTARFHTGCAVILKRSALSLSHLDTTTVVFRPLSAQEIARYVALEQPFDCAGGFKAESLGIALFERLESEDPTALIGLPLIWLAAALRSAGLALP
ncbi:MAG: septum formation protein Maf [Proteobacteria bacterium]|nr:septum formation protein Maf [Pseudomonadota bacterium]